MDGRLTWEQDKLMWKAVNESGEEVGYLMVENVGAHRHWCWYQHNGVWMSPGCLDEVRRKQKELFKDRGKE